MSKMTEDQAKNALAKINSFGKRPCPYCGSTEGFAFAPNALDVFSTEGIKTVISSGYVDSIPVMVGHCKHCGYVVQFSLRALGIV